MEPGKALREVYGSPEIVIVPTIYDALSTRLAAMAGFGAAGLGGSAVSNTLLGMPDAGFVTLTEMEFVLSRAAAASDIPITVDVDSGYGNAVNVVRTVRIIEGAGAAGMMIEDQDTPPRCGHVAGHVIVPVEEMVGKIKAALDARRNDSFVVTARTDARSVEGIDAAIERGQRYVEAGADAFFADGLRSVDEMRRIADEVPARFHVLNLGGSTAKVTTPKPPLEELQAIGFHAVVPGLTPIRVAALSLLRYFQDVRERGTAPDVEFRDEIAGSPLEEWYQFTGFDWVRELEDRYLPADQLRQLYDQAQTGYYEPSASPPR